MSERKLKNLLVKYGVSKDGAKALAFALARHGYDDTADAVREALDDFAKWCDERGVGKTEYPYPIVGRLAEYRAWALPRPTVAAIRARALDDKNHG